MEALVRRLHAYSPARAADVLQISTANIFSAVEYQRGDILIETGAPLEHVFIISSGWAIRYRTLSDGRRQIVNVMLPGDCFDLQALAAHQSDHSVEAITPLRILRAKAAAFRDLMHQNGRLAAAFWWTAIQEESILREQIVRVGRRSGRERIAHLLLEFQRRLQVIGAIKPEDDVVPMPLTRDMLADMLGLSRVHTTRSLGALKLIGLIRTTANGVEILKRHKLAAMAQFDPTYLHLPNAASG
jgi:CRP-like cAMP-binding protein